MSKKMTAQSFILLLFRSSNIRILFLFLVKVNLKELRLATLFFQLTGWLTLPASTGQHSEKLEMMGAPRKTL